MGRDLLNEALKENRIVITRKQDMLSRNFRGSMIVLKEDRVENQVKKDNGQASINDELQHIHDLSDLQ